MFVKDLFVLCVFIELKFITYLMMRNVEIKGISKNLVAYQMKPFATF